MRNSGGPFVVGRNETARVMLVL